MRTDISTSNVDKYNASGVIQHECEAEGVVQDDDQHLVLSKLDIVKYVSCRALNAIGLSWLTFGASGRWERNCANKILKSIEPFISAKIRNAIDSGKIDQILSSAIFEPLHASGSMTAIMCAGNANKFSKMIQAMIFDLANQPVESSGEVGQGQAFKFLTEILATTYQSSETAKRAMNIGLGATLGALLTDEMRTNVLKLPTATNNILGFFGASSVIGSFITDHLFGNEALNVNNPDHVSSAEQFQHAFLRAAFKDIDAGTFAMPNVAEVFTTGPCKQYSDGFLATKKEFLTQLSFGLSSDICSGIGRLGIQMSQVQSNEFRLALFNAISTQDDEAYKAATKQFINICSGGKFSDEVLEAFASGLVDNLRMVANNPNIHGVKDFITAVTTNLLRANDFIASVTEMATGFRHDMPINDAIVEAAERIADGDLQTMKIFKSLAKALPAEFGQLATEAIGRKISEKSQLAGNIFNRTVSITATGLRFTGDVIEQTAIGISAGISKISAIVVSMTKDKEIQRKIEQTPSSNSDVDSLRKMIFKTENAENLLEVRTSILNLTHSNRISKDDAELLLSELSSQIHDNKKLESFNGAILDVTRLLNDVITHANYVAATQAQRIALNRAEASLVDNSIDSVGVTSKANKMFNEALLAKQRHDNLGDLLDEETNKFVKITDHGIAWSANYFLTNDFAHKLSNGYVTVAFNGGNDSSQLTPSNVHSSLVNNSSKVDCSEALTAISSLLSNASIVEFLPKDTIELLKNAGIETLPGNARFYVAVDTSLMPKIALKVTISTPIAISESGDNCGEIKTMFDAVISPSKTNKGWIYTEHKYDKVDISNATNTLIKKEIKLKRKIVAAG